MKYVKQCSYFILQHTYTQVTTVMEAYLLSTAVIIRKSSKAHGPPVLIESACIVVTGHEDDFQCIFILLLETVVELGQHGSEATAGGTPVSGEVDSHQLLIGQCIYRDS